MAVFFPTLDIGIIVKHAWLCEDQALQDDEEC